MERAIGLLVESVESDSPTGKESAVSHLLALFMKKSGFSEVRVDKAGSAIGECGEGRVRVLLCGHIDTVPGHLPVRLRNGRIYGRGSVDAKSAMCAILVSAARFVKDPDIHLTVLCATGEEGASDGIRNFLDECGPYNFAVFGEPGGANKVTLGYRGRMTLGVFIRTTGGHAGSSWAHKSAFDEAVNLIGRLREYERVNSTSSDRYHSVSVSPTLFQAGEAHNVLPAHAKFTCDVRIPVGLRSVDVRKGIRTILESFPKTGGMAIEYRFGQPVEPYESPVSSVLVRAFCRGILLSTGQKPVLLRKTGTGDMNIFANGRRCESITYGPGQAALSHTNLESVKIDDYLQSIEVLDGALRQLKRISNSNSS